jgi:muconolactone D-isomerase
MMEFLVEIAVRLPQDMPGDRIAALRAAELQRGRELATTGVIARIWRIPGTTDNVGIWVADSATELHSALIGLPLFPWLRIKITALAVHPIEEGRQ